MDSLLVLSGGMDSTTMLYDYRDSIAAAVYCHYGANHDGREVECARYHCRQLKKPLIEIDLGFIGTNFKSSLLDGGDTIPSGNYNEENMKSTVVPFRNGIMLAAAAGLAESMSLKKVMIANHAGDHSIYPDCRTAFIKAMGEAISAGTYEKIELFAPYTMLTKGEIALRGKNIGVDYSHTYSCYRGGEHHCGTCGTCRERAEAFAFAGIEITD